MKDSLAHLPPERQAQLRDIAKLIPRHGEGVEMVILSHRGARGRAPLQAAPGCLRGRALQHELPRTREELELLAGHVRTLAAATERACKEHIASTTA